MRSNTVNYVPNTHFGAKEFVDFKSILTFPNPKMRLLFPN